MSIGKFLGRKVVTTFSGAVSGAAGAVVDTATDVMKSVVGGATDVGLQVRKKNQMRPASSYIKSKRFLMPGSSPRASSNPKKMK
jgi:hypothetical protein